jgi:hypothetical protein
MVSEASLAVSPLLRLCGPWSRRSWPAGKAATYIRTATAVVLIISELPGERAEALLIAMAALVPTAGEHSEIQFDKLGAPEPQVTLTYFGGTTA